MEKSKYVVYNNINCCYWVNKKEITRDFNKSSKFDSIEEVIKNVPIFFDWNEDYNIYEYKGDKLIKIIDDNKWIKIHFQFRENEPDRYNQLYKKESTIIINII
jgi:hypothetical protein